MFARVVVFGVCVVGVLGLGGCGPEGPVAGSSSGGAAAGAALFAGSRPTILAASAGGAVVADPVTGSYRGYTSAGRLVWADREAYRTDAEVTCAARCPDAVVSTSGEDGRPGPAWLRSGGGVRPLVGTGGPVRRVLAMRGPSDTVVAEGGRDGRGDLVRVERTDGAGFRVQVPSVADVLWVEDLTRSVALALYGRHGGTAMTVLRFRRDGHGWRPDGRGVRVDGVWGACDGGEGGPAVLAGPRAVLLSGGRGALLGGGKEGLLGDGRGALLGGGREGLLGGERSGLLGGGRSVPLVTGLPQVGECVAGRYGAVLLARRLDGDGTPHTDLRGVDPAGRQVWAREVPAEVEVAANPSGRRFALTGAGIMEIVDQAGRTVSRRAGVASALYTGTGELVVASAAGVIEWLKG
ncbi:hypothetical protein [Sphaerisporangium corydalis]|uniref:Uncharacterized protein n=1 Tax=Sphaerisporangium corydalis TaxID=1441875 RepID=A0ABV9E9Q8_9ACTN|nr:hypothetical protein [Sphaerisporangium corydalis]